MARKAIIFYLVKGNKVLLANIDYGKLGLLWSGVSGYIEEGESEVDAVVRETKEEIGVTVSIDSLEKKGTIHNGFFTVFISYSYTGEPKSCEESIKEVKWFDINNLPFKKMHEGTENYLPDMLTPSPKRD